MASLGTLTVDLIAQTRGFVTGMDKAERASAKWRRQVQKDITAVGNRLKTGLKFGAIAAAAGLAVVIERSRQVIDEQAKMAQRLNTTSESLAVLKRASDRTGLSLKVIETAGRTLEINLGKASQGFAAQKDAVDKLGISAEALSKVPLDERITIINKALRDNVPAYERAAVAADLFGSRGAAAIQQLSPDTIALAAREAKVFGLALSDIDAAKVENANDSFSRLGAAASGIGQQITIAFAPALEAVGEAFFNAAEQAGGVGSAVEGVVDKIVGGFAFVADAADGVGRVFKIVANGYVLAISSILDAFASRALGIIETINKVSGINFSETEQSLRNFVALQEGVAKEAQAEIRLLLETPLAGNALRDAWDEAKRASQEAAEAAVAAREALQGDGLFEIVPNEGNKDILAAGKKLEAERLKSFEDAQKLLESAQARSLKRQQVQQLEHLQWTNEITQMSKKDELNIYEKTFGDISGVARNFAGEQSGIYVALFALEKGAAIARSIVAIQTALAQAAASGPFPANLAAIASVASATASIISTIGGTTLGQAHDGLMSVPQTGTYLLEKGERVTTAKTSAKLDTMLDDAKRGGGMGGGGVRIVNAWDQGMIGDYMGSSDGEKVILNILKRNQRTVRTLAT